MWPGFSSFIADDVPSKDKLSYLNFIWHNGNLEIQDDGDKIMVSETILKWINSPLTRYEGLMLWHVSLEKSHLYLRNWGRLLQASLELSTSCSTRRVALKILNQMVLKFGDKSGYRPAFQQFMPDLMACLLIDLEDNEGFVLSCESLVVCMKYLPDILGTFTSDIERFLVKHLDNESIEVVEALADCFAIFPNCMMYYLRPRCAYSEGWADLYAKAVNTLQSLFEDILLFQIGSNGPRTETDRTLIFAVPCSLEGGLSYLCHKVRVFSSLSRCLSKLMCSESQRVKVYLEELLELIKRVISFPGETATQGMDHSLIHLIFPKMCQVAFMLLEAIILNFNVVEHTDNILEVALKAIANAQIASPTPVYHGEVQLQTWKFLNIWMKQCGCTVSCKIVSEKIVGELLSDIAISRSESDDSVLIKQTCAEALKVLNVLVTSACCFFEKKNIEFLISAILQIVRQVQIHSHPLKTLPYPYSDDNCRLELYNLLLTCCVNEHPCQNNCILRSVNFFKLALRDPSIEVTNVCQKACNLFVYYFNPKKPPPDYTLPINVETNQMEEQDEDVIADWDVTDTYEDNWHQEQLTGPAAPANIIPAPHLYQTEGVFQEAVVDNENSQEGPAEQDSPPHYEELGPSNQYNDLRTLSVNSSASEDVDESESEEEDDDMDEGKKNSSKNRSPNKHKRATTTIPVAQNTNRPNIQILEARSTTLANEARTDEDSSDANVTVIRDVQSDQNSMEEDASPVPSPKRVVSENGGVEESDEEEEGFDEEEDEVEEEEEGDGDVTEERFSPEPEERPIKKQKFNSVDEMSSGEESNRQSAECEEISEDVKEDKENNPEINGLQGESGSSLPKDSPTVEEMMSDFVLAEAVDS